MHKRIYTYIHTVLTMLASDSAVSGLELVGGTPPIITGPLLPPSLALGGLGPVSPCKTSPASLAPSELVPGIPGSGQHPESLSGTVRWKILVSPGNKNSAFFVLPSLKIISVNSYAFQKPHFSPEWLLGCVNPSPG